MNLKNKRNPYIDTLGATFDETPKAVFAALAFSFAMRLNEDNQEKAKSELAAEWKILHQAGIIPQRPPKVAP